MQNPSTGLDQPWIEATARVRSPDDDRYRLLGLLNLTLGNGLDLVYSRADRAAHVMPTAEARLLAACTRFGSLADHAQALARSAGSPALAGELERMLARCRDRGLLVSQRELVQEFLQGVRGAGAPARVDCLAVITKDRLGALERCLAGHLAQHRERGTRRRFLVVDDSAGTAARDRTHGVLDALEARFGIPVDYAGVDEKRRFRDALVVESGAPADVVDFALFGSSICAFRGGANRNALLLGTPGDVVLSVDDDTSARIGTVEAPRPGVALVSDDPRAMWFFPDHAATLSAARFLDQDLTCAHEELLGKQAGECLLGEDVDLDQLTPALVERLRRGGRIRVTQAGILGDSGMSSPSSYLWRDGASRDRLLATEQAYRAAIRGRQTALVAPRKTITDFPLCVSTTLGLDNRELVPPFVPVARGEDTLFGLTLARCVPGAFLGHVPVAVLHQPVETREFSPDEVWQDARRTPFKLLLWCFLVSAPFGAADRDDASRLRTLGRHLVEIGGLPGAEFLELARIALWREAAVTMRTVEQRLAAAGRAPAYWASDVDRYLETLREALPDPAYAAPCDLGREGGPAEALRLAQRVVRDFGALLVEWPALVAASTRLRARGLGLVQQRRASGTGVRDGSYPLND